MKQIISSPNAPAAVGPYSQGVCIGNQLFLSGQIPINPATGAVEATDIQGQAKQVFANINALIEAAGFTMDNIVKTTVLLADMSYFGAMNEIYAAQFSDTYPARSTFAVKELPKQVLIEVEVIAVKG